MFPGPRPIVCQYWNIVFQLYIVGPLLHQCIQRVYYYLIRCSLNLRDTFFPENRLCIIDFDSHDVHSKIMINFVKIWKKYEILGDAFFEQDNGLQY